MWKGGKFALPRPAATRNIDPLAICMNLRPTGKYFSTNIPSYARGCKIETHAEGEFISPRDWHAV